MTTIYLPRVLTGRLSNGAERGRGRLVHAVADGDAWGIALCGARPGRLSGSGFVAPPPPADAPITCGGCLKRLERVRR